MDSVLYRVHLSWAREVSAEVQHRGSRPARHRTFPAVGKGQIPGAIKIRSRALLRQASLMACSIPSHHWNSIPEDELCKSSYPVTSRLPFNEMKYEPVARVLATER